MRRLIFLATAKCSLLVYSCVGLFCMSHSLIIFDCDGTLVDSETLYNTVTSELLISLGFEEYTPHRCLELFAGQSWGTIKTILEDKHGADIPRDIIERYIKITSDRMETDIVPAPDSNSVITTLKGTHTVCVASNGERNNVIKSLNITGLIRHFSDDLIFTKSQVKRPKPHPDLFLFAAEKMDFNPDQCLVIEDSEAGVEAACAANMRVLGYTGCAHDKNLQKKLLHEAGADIVTDQLIHILDHL